MRRELETYTTRFGIVDTQKWHLRVLDSWKLHLFERAIGKVKSGSEEWHIWQQRVSLGAPVGSDMTKRNLFYTRTLGQCGTRLYVLPHVNISYPYEVYIGENVFINRGVIITARERITIGNNVIIGPYAIINSGSHIYSDPHKLIRDQCHRRAPISIGDDVWIGGNVTILPGVNIGPGAVVAAGSVVTKSVDDYSVVAGVPARLLKMRSAT